MSFILFSRDVKKVASNTICACVCSVAEQEHQLELKLQIKQTTVSRHTRVSRCDKIKITHSRTELNVSSVGRVHRSMQEQ